MYVPFTGLGAYNGFRGNRWLKNRIKIFKQFVVPSLQAQNDQDFTVWASWRREERGNKYVDELYNYLNERFTTVFTYGGVCFWDDKYSDKEARERLIESLHTTAGQIVDYVGDEKTVLVTIQPSDDCYHQDAVSHFKRILKKDKWDAAGFTRGYISNYQTKEIKEYNPETNPPFFTIKFTKETFLDPLKHLNHIGPYKSHEYVSKYLKYKEINERGFLVGTHGENISTVFNHPYAQKIADSSVLKEFGLNHVPALQISYSWRKQLMRTLPHGWQRKLRYIFGERFFHRLYKFLRN